ncbi:MAG: DUF6493 family protein [Flavihumibacter sp.]|nr:DUF6493 family protein [Flavihumibacter sp.]
MSDQITYSYATPSSLVKGLQGDELFLANYSEVQKKTNPCFFWGRLKDPHTTARCLIALSNVVQSSFSLSPFELAKLKDPIVTAGNEKIRFEGFSHCAGVYARVDVLPDGHDGEFIDTGTTNVDFNQPMISSLSRIGKGEQMLLSVGSKEVSISAGNRKVVERKVPLPVKWIKGLTSVQLFLADTEHRFPVVMYPELLNLPYFEKTLEFFTGQYAWQTVKEDYEYEDSDWSSGKRVKVIVKATRKQIRLDFPKRAAPKEESNFKKILSLFKGGKEKPDGLPPLLVEYMKIGQTFLSREDYDMRRMHGLIPAYPEPLMSVILHQCLKENQFTSETDKRAVIALLQAYYESPVRLGEMGHLFLSASLLCSDKTAAAYAAEIWIRDHARLNNKMPGEMLGKHQRIEFAPMKRFTDLVVGKMMSVSASSNAALQVLLHSMIEQLPEEPLRGQKKLLEIRAELGKQKNKV